jgi:hypothetical protein
MLTDMPSRARPARRRLAPLLAAALAILAASGAATRPASAKEHTSGCAALLPSVERLRGALLLAAVHRARGSAMGVHAVLLASARSVTSPLPPGCGFFTRPLLLGLERAGAARTAAAANLALEVGYAGALALALTGGLPRNDLLGRPADLAESAEYGQGCAEIFTLARRLAGPASEAPSRAKAVLADLAARPRCAAVRKLLEGAAPEDLAHAIDSLLLDEKVAEPETPTPFHRCPELPIVLERLASAVSVGAPLYNRGDHEGCRAHYDRTARALAAEVIPPGRCPVVRVALAGAIREAAAAKSPSDAAWALRRAFDRITSPPSP